MDALHRSWKWVLSFRKHEWRFDDYPITVRCQAGTHGVRDDGSRIPPWVATIRGLYFHGTGESRDEALEDLRQRFEQRRTEGSLPRPGRKADLRMASQERMSQLADLAREFFPPVLDYDFDDCIITDESSIWDFPLADREAVVRKVLVVFQTDIADLVEKGNIAAILERIAAQRQGDVARA